MRTLLLCSLSAALSACGAAVAVPGSPDAGARDDAPSAPDVIAPQDVAADPRCPPAARELALDGEAVVDNLTNAPIAAIGACGRAELVQHHVFTLRVPRAATVALTAESSDPSARGIALTLGGDCASPELACVGANAELRSPLAAGAYRVVVSTRISRWIPYRLRAVTAR